MTALPAYCPRCKTIFPFTGIEVGAGPTILEGNTTACPVCGFREARVSDGVYKATQEAVDLLSGPESTRAMLEAFKAVAERLKAGEISKDQAIREAHEISPRYAAFIDTLTRVGIPWVQLMLTIITVYLALSASQDSEKIVEAITQQTVVIKDIAEQYNQGKAESPSGHKSESKTPTVKNKRKRRAQVNHESRERLKQKRLTLGRARTH